MLERYRSRGNRRGLAARCQTRAGGSDYKGLRGAEFTLVQDPGCAKMGTGWNGFRFSILNAQHEPLENDLQAAAARVLRAGRFILGTEGAAFEGELAASLGVGHVVGVSSGTDGLLALLMAVGIRPGAEVVTTPYSFVSTVEAIVRLGARPVFADIELSSMNLDPDEAVRRIGPRTRAVLTVHLFGRAARTEGLRAAAIAQGVPLLEDAAQAIGASGVGAGLAQVLSFFPSKNLGGFGDGGAVLTDDPELAARLRRLRNHGAAEKMRHDVLGGNFRLDELQAALLRVKLPHLARWTAERRRLAALYRERLSNAAHQPAPARRRLRVESVRRSRSGRSAG